MDRPLVLSGIFFVVLVFAISLASPDFLRLLVVVPRFPLVLNPSETVTMFAGPLRSIHLWDAISFAEYPLFCYDVLPPKATSMSDEYLQSANIGQLLSSESYVRTKLQVSFKTTHKVTLTCQRKYLDQELEDVSYLIHEHYCLNFAFGGIDVRLDPNAALESPSYCLTGLPIGYLDKYDDVVFYNHMDFEMLVRNKDGGVEILDVMASPRSLGADPTTCLSEENTVACPSLVLANSSANIQFSHRIFFTEVEKIESTHFWFSWGNIIFPLVVVVLLAVLMNRTHQKLLERLSLPQFGRPPSVVSSVYQLKEEISYTPAYFRFLTFIVGFGSQLWFTINTSMILESLGVISPPFRGTLLTSLILIYFFGNFVAGFCQVVLEREMKGGGDSGFSFFKRNPPGVRSRMNNLGSALISQLWTLGLLLLLVLWNTLRIFTVPHSYVTSSTIFLLVAIWICVGLPVSVIGRSAGSFQSFSKVFEVKFFLGAIFIFALSTAMGWLWHILSSSVALIILYHLTRYILPCKDRKIVITPWHVSSMVPNGENSDSFSSLFLFLPLASIPALSLIPALRHIIMVFSTNEPHNLTCSVIVVGFISFTLSCLLTSAVTTVLLIMRKESGGIAWKGFLSTGLSALFLFLYLLFYFAAGNELDSNLQNVISVGFLVGLVTIILFLVSGSLGFYGSQYYLCRLFQSFGTLVTGDLTSQMSSSEVISSVSQTQLLG